MSVSTVSTSAPAPRLVPTTVPGQASAVALVLHGGGGRGTVPVRPMQLSVLRMVPIAARVARASSGRLAVYRLLNAVRGFATDPLTDVRWALQQLAERHPDLPVALVGHSLGGSVALAAADQPAVHTVVALAPWLGGSEPVQQLRGRSTLIVHGSADRVTSADASERYAHRARHAGASLSFVRVERGEHTMLRRMPAFDVLAARYVRACLQPGEAGRRPSGYRSKIEQLAVRACDEPGDYRI